LPPPPLPFLNCQPFPTEMLIHSFRVHLSYSLQKPSPRVWMEPPVPPFSFGQFFSSRLKALLLLIRTSDIASYPREVVQFPSCYIFIQAFLPLLPRIERFPGTPFPLWQPAWRRRYPAPVFVPFDLGDTSVVPSFFQSLGLFRF